MSEEFINIDDYLKEHVIFQVQLENENVFIKKIGKSKTSDYIEIFKNMGLDKNISLYSVVYTKDELKECMNTGGMFDLLKLYEIDDNNYMTTNLCVLIRENIFEKELDNYVTNNFDIYLISELKNNEHKFVTEIKEKNLNKNNMIEKILQTHTEMKKTKHIIK